MFSQFKNAVEQLAQQVPVPQIPGVDEHLVRRGSTEINRSISPLSSGQLAESALTSLRRSLSSQRPDPVSRSNSGSSGTPPPARKSNLEERLRRAAHNAIVEGSPNSSSRKGSSSRSSSPAPNSINQTRSQSPASVPLPQSPLLNPTNSSIVPEKLSNLQHTDEGNPEPSETSQEQVNKAKLASTSEERASELKYTAGDVSKDNDSDTQVETDKKKTSPSNSEEAGERLGADADSPRAIAQAVDGDSAFPPKAPSPEATKPTEKDSPSPATPSDLLPQTDSPAESELPDGRHDTVSVLAVATSPSVAEPSELVPTITKEGPELKGPGVEELQQRLKQVEQRFSDVSTSFKRLQAEKRAADAVLRELTPLESIQDNEGLGDYLKNVQSKISIFQEEIKRLNAKIGDYEGQLEDLRNTHLSETKSQSDQIEKLRVQLKETEALFQASEKAVTQVEDNIASHKSETDQLNAQIEKLRTLAKEEEEKRVKAISLLKTVRQKLVKTEKERDEALQQAAASKDLDKDERDKERAERLKLQHDLEAMQIEKEKTAAAQRAQYDRDLALMKERYEKELSAVKGQLELDIITLKSSHSKDIAAKNSQISTLENSLNNVTRDKNSFFEQLQIKQAETESAQGHLESLQLQNTELEFQLREANDRLALLREEYAEYQREQEVRAREPVTSADDIAQMISATESRYEVKLAEMKRSVEVLERERGESEANWSRKLKEKVKEVEDLSRLLGTTAKSREEDIGIADKLRADLARSQEEIRLLREQVAEVPVLQDRIQELKRISKEQEQESHLKQSLVEKQIEDYKSRESQLKQANKTLKDELRKVQTSAALLERQRNPGVGYWNNRAAAESEGSQQASPTIGTSSRVSSPAPGSAKQEEEVNLEYLRNVILQFLEHKEMRPNLVKVISIILHFTPQETRRLMAKV
ncbi:hypothetical protein CC2G_001073 [Coprinopsis cinerea AmutBmut pab1-1]|nr:hypothetical protein CC2G_001073 [Coprinopsis cinerea AmutBmut pab1-1]